MKSYVQKAIICVSFLSMNKINSIAQSTDKENLFPSIQEATKPATKPSDVAPKSFDPAKENYDRYKNSPCFKEIGFIPGRDNERLYKECEERLQKESLNRTSIVLLLIAGVSTLGFLFYRSFKKSKNTNET